MVGVTTKRTPINRPPRPKITPEALEAFRTMQRLERRCTCKNDDGDDNARNGPSTMRSFTANYD
jgi:hypothetical protein